MGYSCHISRTKALLNQKQHQKHHTWAKEKTGLDWACLVVQSAFGKQGPRVSRESGEAQNPSCLKSSLKFPQSVMFWGIMSSAGVGPVLGHYQVQSQCSHQPGECLMLLSADKLSGDADFFLQLDLATCPQCLIYF